MQRVLYIQNLNVHPLSKCENASLHANTTAHTVCTWSLFTQTEHNHHLTLPSLGNVWLVPRWDHHFCWCPTRMADQLCGRLDSSERWKPSPSHRGPPLAPSSFEQRRDTYTEKHSILLLTTERYACNFLRNNAVHLTTRTGLIKIHVLVYMHLSFTWTCIPLKWWRCFSCTVPP